MSPNIPLVKVFLPPPAELMPALEKVLYSGMIAEGESVYQFEAAFGAHFSLSNVLAMSSGTAALHAALTLAGAGPGSEVISTAMTAEPTNTSILYSGAKLVWADVDPASGNLDPASVRASITPRTRAILVVHYAGYPARLAELRAVADEFGIALIEDCAHALGASYGGAPIGSIGDFAIYSFQAIKHMTTVDGGVLVVKDAAHMEAARKFRWFGMLKGVPRTEIDITSVGYKYNMNNVNATVGLVQLGHIDGLLAAHRANGRFYDAAFGEAAGLAFARCDDGTEPTYWLYTLLSDRAAQIEQALLAAGVSASKLHRPNSLHTIFAPAARPLPGLDAFYRRLLHIPCGWWVSAAQRERIAQIVLEHAC